MAKLEFAERGAGGRPLLLLHGFTGAKEDFTEWLEPLAQAGWHAVAPDHRGHGASEKPSNESDYTFATLANDAFALADELWGSDSPFVLLGHSMGGMVAQVMATQFPDRVAALVLMDTLYGPLPFVTREEIEAAVAVVQERGTDGLADLFAERGSPLDTPAHLRLLEERAGYAEFNDRKFRDTASAAYAGLLAAMYEADDRLASLRTLAMPTLVIAGEQDKPIVQPSRDMVAAITGADLAIITDAGHSPQFENPEAWWSALSTFLERVGSRV